MNDSSMQERRQWFFYFPEGSIEFFLVTRIMLILLLLVFIVAAQQHYAYVLVAMAGILWIDYALALWWAVQMATDLQGIRQPTTADQAYHRRLRVIVIGLLPSIPFFLLIAPWPNWVSTAASDRTMIWRITLPTLGLTAIVLIAIAQKALRDLGVDSTIRRCLMLVPLLHWFTLHQWIIRLDRELNRLAEEKNDIQLTRSDPGAVVTLSRVMWFLGVLPWLILIPGRMCDIPWLSASMFKGAAVCSLVFTCIFAVADTAAMEAVQRKFVTLLRRLT